MGGRRVVRVKSNNRGDEEDGKEDGEPGGREGVRAKKAEHKIEGLRGPLAEKLR